MALKKVNPTQTEAWQKIQMHFETMKSVQMQELFANDNNRAEKMHMQWNDFLVDYSKNIATQETIDLLLELAHQVDLKDAISKYFKGDLINQTEDRAVLHTALRATENSAVMVDGINVMPEIFSVKNKIKNFSNEVISWDRKHYEYPDNPKNIQITQFHHPIIPDGQVSCYRNDGSKFTVELTQVHIEEDAAKLMHEKTISLVDFNKAGVPLIEIVTKPCVRNIEDASIYAQYIQRIVQNLKISEANLEKGEFKSDVSVSLRKKGTQDLNPRTEIKNLNSFKFMVEALKEEVEKQFNYYIENKAFRPDQTTVLWDADLKQTKTMRKKEFEADYRFISEPDLPFVSIKEAINAIKVDASVLPYAVETILIEGGVLPQDAKFFTADSLRSETFVAINNVVKDPSFVAKTLANNIKPEQYTSIANIEDIINIFSLFKQEKVTVVLVQNALKSILENPQFDYKKYFEENTNWGYGFGSNIIMW